MNEIEQTVDEIYPNVHEIEPTVDDIYPTVDEIEPTVDDIEPSVDETHRRSSFHHLTHTHAQNHKPDNLGWFPERLSYSKLS